MGLNYIDVRQPSMALNALTTITDQDTNTKKKEMVIGELKFQNTMAVDDEVHSVEHILGHAKNIGKGSGRMYALAIHCHGVGYQYDDKPCGFGYQLKIGKGNMTIAHAPLFQDMDKAFEVVIFAACAVAQVSIPGGLAPGRTKIGVPGLGDGMMFCKAVAKTGNVKVYASDELQTYPLEACPYGKVPMQGRWFEFLPGNEQTNERMFGRYDLGQTIARGLNLPQCVTP